MKTNNQDEWPDIIGGDPIEPEAEPYGVPYSPLLPTLMSIKATGTNFDSFDGLRQGDAILYNPHQRSDKDVRGRHCVVRIITSGHLCIRTLNPKDERNWTMRDEYCRRGWSVKRDSIEVLGTFWGVERVAVTGGEGK